MISVSLAVFSPEILEGREEYLCQALEILSSLPDSARVASLETVDSWQERSFHALVTIVDSGE